MAYLGRSVELTRMQAAQLLSRVEGTSVVDLKQVGFTNDVFRVTTESHGNYYIKFYTARWYKDDDGAGSVSQELGAYGILKKRGILMQYEMWGDISFTIVPEAVLITSELPGAPVPRAIAQHPEEEDRIWQTLGECLRQIDDIEFTRCGPLSPATAERAAEAGRIPVAEHPPVGSVDARHLAEERQAKALAAVEQVLKKELIPESVALALKSYFTGMAEVLEEEFAHPRFTSRNAHDHHFHVSRSAHEWKVVGLYDFEHAWAFDSHVDLMLLEMTVTPQRRSYRWREPFLKGYGSIRNFEAFKMHLFLDLLESIAEGGRWMKRTVPNLEWLNGCWEALIGAQQLADLLWFPVHEEPQAIEQEHTY